MKDLFVADEKVVNLLVTWMKEKKSSTCVPPTYEAEWQLLELELERAGKIDGILGVDSDFVILGAKTLLLDATFHSKASSCYLYNRQPDLFGGKYNLRGYSPKDLAASRFHWLRLSKKFLILDLQTF